MVDRRNKKKEKQILSNYSRSWGVKWNGWEKEEVFSPT